MARLLTKAYILETYGLRLFTEQIAQCLGMKATTVANKISDNTLGIAVRYDGRRPFVDYEDMAEHVDEMAGRKQAKQPKQEAQPA
jgi:hypothetical protein